MNLKLGPIALLLLASIAHAQTEVEFWHGMGGPTGTAVKEIADEFNASQKEYRVVAVYKGNYSETLTAAIAAFRAKQPPAIVQVYEVGTAAMMAAKGAVYPVYQLMADTGEKFEPKNYVAPVLSYYSTLDGKLLSMPFNSSTAVLFWNKELFKKAGLNPDVPPRTWDDMASVTAKIAAAGLPCGLTVEYAPWTMIESVGAFHDKPFATQQNGFAGKGAQLVFNDPLRIRLIEMLAAWTKDGRFKYYGRDTKSLANFTSGECAMHIASTGVTSFIENAFVGKSFGTSFVPYFPDVIPQPKNSLIGGATLWVLKGKSKETYKGVAKFFSYIARPDVQSRWHQRTGFIPITTAAYELSKKEGYYDKHPAREIGYKSLLLSPPSVNSRGLRIGNFVQLREVEDSELEAIFNGQKTAKQGLDAMVEQGNVLLRKFDASVE